MSGMITIQATANPDTASFRTVHIEFHCGTLPFLTIDFPLRCTTVSYTSAKKSDSPVRCSKSIKSNYWAIESIAHFAHCVYFLPCRWL